MIWNNCLVISALLFAISIICSAVISHKNIKRALLTPFNIIFAGAFSAIFAAQVPIFAISLSGEIWSGLKIAVLDFLQTIQVFTLNVGARDIIESISSSEFSFSGIYSTYVTVLFCIAPILTFGFIISFIRSAVSSIRFGIHYTDDVYIFSALNEKSVTLAESIKSRNSKALIVFTDVSSGSECDNGSYIDFVAEMNAVIFRKDIPSLDFMKHSRKSQINFFIISEDENINLMHSLKIIEKYRNRDNIGLYAFLSSQESDVILSNADKGKIRLRRINEARSAVYNFLFNEGNRIFESACTDENGKNINAVILGLGDYGTEMLKSLAWYCQMDGYKLRIDAFDIDERAESEFRFICPELMSEKINGNHNPGESEYDICIHSGIDVMSYDFVNEFSKLMKPTFVFICIGNDTDNISQSVNVRMLCERAGCSPLIKTVVYSNDKKSALENAKNYRGQKYGIETLGDLESLYSEEIIVGTKLEKLALERHLKWGSEEEFWQYEYNYRSSMAAAIHFKAKTECGVLSSTGKLSEEDRLKLERLEHRRWNAYMRSEGYVFSGSTEKESRNDLAKMHHDLVSYDLLSEAEKRKDSSVGS